MARNGYFYNGVKVKVFSLFNYLPVLYKSLLLQQYSYPSGNWALIKLKGMVNFSKMNWVLNPSERVKPQFLNSVVRAFNREVKNGNR